MWSVHENQTRNEQRGKDSLLKKQGQENWPPSRKNIREGHPLGHRKEIELKTRHLHMELSPPAPTPECSEMDLRSALSWTQEMSTSSSFSPLAAPPCWRAQRQPRSSQLGAQPRDPGARALRGLRRQSSRQGRVGSPALTDLRGLTHKQLCCEH